jgi:hypothetical protein
MRAIYQYPRTRWSALLRQRLPDPRRNRRWHLVDGERHGALESAWAGDEHAHVAALWIASNPCFVRPCDVLAAGDNGRLDSLAAGGGDAFGIEHSQGHF